VLSTRSKEASVPVSVVSDRSALMRAAAERIATVAREAIERHGRFDWVLSGGSTPEQLYALLASPEQAHGIDWERVAFFFGDERCVPPDDPQSNYRMAFGALLAPLGVRSEQVHRMRGELGAAAAAADYQTQLERCPGLAASGLPSFDLVLLGLGGDGHTASLFPGTAALDERSRWVVESHPAGLVPRVTLTFPVLDAARRVLFLASGADKAGAVRRVLHGTGAEPLPAARVRPHAGDAEWLLDAAAAAELGNAR
jgi:6-phosphogluconolactonase